MMQQARDLLIRVRRNGACSDADTKALFLDGRVRDELYRALLADAHPQDRPLIAALLDYETKEHALHQGLSDDMVIASCLVANQRRVEDSPSLWNAKAVNFSTWSGLSVVLLVAGGVDETIAYWKAESGLTMGKSAKTALNVIEQARADGRLDDVDGRLVQIRTYCENSLRTRDSGTSP